MFSFPDLFLTTAVPSLSCRHPSIRTLGERLTRSVHIGCSRYSRRCHLLGRPLVPSCDGAGARPRAQSPELDILVWCIQAFPELCRCQSPLSRVVERLVLLAADPEMMEQNCQLACHRDDGAFLSAFASAFG